ncbi:MAG: FtsX-like permease family protein [Stackebrandtia sp.]
MLVDLDYLNRATQSHLSPADADNSSMEVWADESAPSDLSDRLEEAGFAVTQTDLRAERVERLSRAAPAVSLRLYLFAAFAILALVLGAVVLTSVVSAAERSYDSAALKLMGVTRRTLRRASIREHLTWFVIPVGAGIGAGVVGLTLVLPRVALVDTERTEVLRDYAPGVWWPAVGLAAVIGGFALVTWLLAGHGVRRADSHRLRETVN